MKRFVWICLLVLYLAVPAGAEEWTAPQLTGDATALLPQESSSFIEDFGYILRSAIEQGFPQLKEGMAVCMSIVAVMLFATVLQSFSGAGKAAAQLVAVVLVACILLNNTNSMIELAVQTIEKLSEYMRLLLPVLASAQAAMGATSSSAALYTLTAALDAVAATAISNLLVPLVYVFLILSIVGSACDEDTLQKLRGGVKSLLTWLLKTVLYVYIGFLSVTGVVAGTADQVALKTAKLTISGAVPVVGGILSDASETILVGASVVKNTVGVYGLTAVIAICICPFLRIGVQYLLIKLTTMVCGMYAEKKSVSLIEDFATAMGLLLAMTGTVSLLMMISIICFLKGMV